MLFGHSRQDTRDVFFTAWKKYRAKQAMAGVETVVVDVVLVHPEYHRLLEQPDHFRDKDYLPELGEINPFLHMGMHVAIEEQLTLDRPAGIRDKFQTLSEQLQDPHAAQHMIMDCLAEMLWSSQRSGLPPDETAYLACMDEKSSIKSAK